MNKYFKHKMDMVFKNSYERLVKGKFDEFYYSLSTDMENIVDINKRDIIYKNLNTTIKKTKSRWFNKYISSKKTMEYKEIEAAAFHYNKVRKGEMTLEKFQMLYDAKDIENLKMRLLGPIYKWKDNEDALLTEYPYLKEQTKKSLTAAYRNDILKLYYIFIRDNSKEVTRIPSVLGNIPVDPTNKKDYFDEDEKEQLDNLDEFTLEGTIDKLIYTPMSKNELIMKLEKKTYLRIESGKESQDLITQIALIKATKALNNLDARIISHYYTHFHNIVSGTSIDKYISDLVRELGLSDSKANYKNVEDSLRKIGSIRLESPEYDGRELKGSLLEIFIDVKDGRKVAKVYLGAFLKNLILMDSSLNFNKDVYDKLSADAQQIAIWLQNRRLKGAIDSNEFTDHIPLKEFADAILMNTKSIYKQRDRIITSLTELKECYLIVRDFIYEKKEFGFIIKYIELPSNVIKKIQNKEFKSGELIEGIEYSVEGK